MSWTPYLEASGDLVDFVWTSTRSLYFEVICPTFSISGEGRYPEMLNPRDKSGRPRKPNIKDYYPIESEYSLSQRKVFLKRIPQRMPVAPFEDYKEIGRSIPNWWTNHNKIKHSFSKENFRLANLETAKDALAGAFLLNVVHKPAVFRLNQYGLLKGKYGLPRLDKFSLEDSLKNSKPPVVIETEVFYYDYEENPKYK